MSKKYYSNYETGGVSTSIEMTDYSDEVKSKISSAIKAAMKAVGVQAMGHAVTYITERGAIDTGLLRNSITYALGGQAPAKATYQAAYGSNRKTKGKDKGKRYSAKSKKAGTVGKGSYSGTAPADGDHETSVYIGTNVEYAPYVELGTVKMTARPFLRPAIENFQDEYRQLFQKAFDKLK